MGAGTQVLPTPFVCWENDLGIVVLVCDVLKGVIPVVLARYLSNPVVTVLVAFATVIGHTFSVFLRGRGGKGLATGAGAAVAMLPLPMACLLVLFVVILLVTRTVSIASITCTISLPVLAGLLYRYGTGVWAVPLAYVVACTLMAAVVLWAHRGNMKRLLQGTEPKVVFPWSPKDEDTADLPGSDTDAGAL